MEFGRPTAYRPEYCDDIVTYFNVPAKTDGTATEFPTVQDFACKIGVTVATLLNWCDKYPDFAQAYALARQKQESILLKNAMDGGYSAQFAKFFAINCFDGRYKDKQDVDLKQDTTISFAITASGDADADAITG